jgi:hypothetical protein
MMTMSTQHIHLASSSASQSPDEHWLGLLARSGQTPVADSAAAHSFLSKLKRIEPTDGHRANPAAAVPTTQLFARLVQAGASTDEAAAEIEARSLAKALSDRRVKMEAKVPKADEALFSQLQRRLSPP